MESRIITILKNAGTEKVTIETGAETLGELQQEMTRKGISYLGLAFYEAISHTTLEDTSAQLPKNLTYKGVQTNNLVFYLSEKNKKIDSGSYRTEVIYPKFKDLLKEYPEVKDLLTCSYTNTPTATLENILNDYDYLILLENKCNKKCNCAKEKCEEELPNKPSNSSNETNFSIEDLKDSIKNYSIKEIIYFTQAFNIILTNIIEEKHNEEISTLTSSSKINTPECPYSDSELSELLNR